MNSIFTFRQELEFDKATQQEVDQVQFSVIPEMRIVKEEVEIDEEFRYLFTVPYQANVKDEAELEYFMEKLGNFGVVDLLGVWLEDGSQQSFDINKYRSALCDIEVYEDVCIINGEDFTGREDEFQPKKKLDADGKEIFIKGEVVFIAPNIERFKELKEKTRPTLAQAKTTQVNTFNNTFKRNLQ